MSSRALVVFGKSLPKKGTGWFKDFDVLIADSSLESEAQRLALSFESLETFLLPGSVQEASEVVRQLSVITTNDGRRIAKLFEYKGYELWWMHYDDLYYKFCLPYTQYKKLLAHLKVYKTVQLYKPPFAPLFEYFLQAHGRGCGVIENPTKKTPPFAVWIQLGLNLPFLLWLMLSRPRLMVWTSDLFDPPRDHDFRMRFVYEELYKKKIHFVEFIRSQERWRTVLRHAAIRRRPVIYTHAIITALHALAHIISRKKRQEIAHLLSDLKKGPEENFRFLIATHYLRNIKGDMWSIKTMRHLLRLIGIRAAIIPANQSRNFSEALACKLLNIPSVGILHGIASKDYNVYDFMPEFDGKKSLSVEKYGVWSQWWKDYYRQHSRAYQPEQLVVSGPMRPLQQKSIPTEPYSNKNPLKVLFVSEQLGVPSEMVQYLSALLEAKNLSIYITFRSYRDGFEDWLKEHRPDILARVDQKNILRSGITESIARCDVIVGSHSTAVLEALLQLKPPIFFKSSKWGDYFELEFFASGSSFLAGNPIEFLELVRKSKDIPINILQELQERFFGDSHMNGSEWAVEQAEEFLNKDSSSSAVVAEQQK